MAGYGDLCTQFYDLDKPRAPELALAWYREKLAGVTGRILEPMCGSGRFLIPLLQAGLRVDGVDASGPMLAAARARLAAAGLSTRLWQQALESLDLPERDYAAAFIPASSFCLLQDASAALHRLRAYLKRGALLLLEFETPHDAPDSTSTRTVTDGSRQIRLASRHSFDAATGIETHHNHYQLKRAGRVVQEEEEVLRLQCYTPQAMAALLASAGFSGISTEHPEFGWVACARVKSG